MEPLPKQTRGNLKRMPTLVYRDCGGPKRDGAEGFAIGVKATLPIRERESAY